MIPFLNKTFSKQLYFLILFSSLVLTTISCSYNHSKTYIENDNVKSTKRIKKIFYYHKDLEKGNSFYTSTQKILKSINSNENISYDVYEVITLDTSSYKLEDTIYLLIDETIVPIKIEDQKIESTTNISENKETITKIDSTTIDVVTGYTQSNIKKIKISYHLNQEIIKKINFSNEVLFRYYAGPDMITLKMAEMNLRELKKMIEMM